MKIEKTNVMRILDQHKIDYKSYTYDSEEAISGMEVAKVLNYAGRYPVTYKDGDSVMLKLTHGTGDDNVHHQNTLQLLDVLHRTGKKFDFMIYPDGMHGYRGYQGEHFLDANRDFWLKYLFSK